MQGNCPFVAMASALRSRFVVATESQVWSDQTVRAKWLRSERLYKTLSWLLARAAGINVPASLLLLAGRRDATAGFAEKCGRPLMTGRDYRKPPPRKPIGGIPLYELDTVYR